MPSKPPDDLGAEGRALFRRIERWRAEQDLHLDPHEVPQVAELARTVDRLATCRAALERLDPATPAWCRLASEERQQRLAYGRQVSSLGFPSGVVDDGASVGNTPRSRRAQKAAAARWEPTADIREARKARLRGVPG
jgi:hypothetical protein